MSKELNLRRAFSHFTEDQKDAVFHKEGPLLILASAGSGKTRVITQRIIYLISEGVEPYQILAITFTNKASREMKSRINEYVGGEDVWVCTFHAFCAKLLRNHASLVGYNEKFAIYDTDDCKSLIKSIAVDLGFDGEKLEALGIKKEKLVARLYEEIFKAKQIRQFEFTEEPFDLQNIFVPVFNEYHRRLKEYNAMDFEDLLINTAKLLEEHSAILSTYQNFLKYVLVDEYQDTNEIQCEIIFNLVRDHKNICVCGDPNQSIYAFRGAKIQNILNFQKIFPDAKVIKLAQNFRSTRNIVDASSEVVSNNTQKFEAFKAFTENEEGNLIRCYQCVSDEAEAYLVSKLISLLTKKGYKYKDICVLYRVHFLSKFVEDGLIQNAIPYRLTGGTAFYERKEIKDILAYLRVALNPTDATSLLRIINFPVRGIGKAYLSRIRQYAYDKGISLYECLERIEEVAVSPKVKNEIRNFLSLLKMVSSKLEDAFSAFSYIVAHLKIKDHVDETANHSRQKNVDELLRAVMKFGMNAKDRSVVAFLEQLALDEEMGEEEQEESADGKVSLMTIHASKGLEFPVVIVVGVEDGCMPHKFCEDETAGGPEEERRVCYVAFTRAKKELILSYTESRFRYGQVIPSFKSPYFDEFSKTRQKDHRIVIPYGDFLKKTEKKVSKVKADQEVGEMVFLETIGTGRIISIKNTKAGKKAVVRLYNGDEYEVGVEGN